MLHSIILCYFVLYYNILYCIRSSHWILYYIILYYTTILCYMVLYYILLCYIIVYYSGDFLGAVARMGGVHYCGHRLFSGFRTDVALHLHSQCSKHEARIPHLRPKELEISRQLEPCEVVFQMLPDGFPKSDEVNMSLRDAIVLASTHRFCGELSKFLRVVVDGSW